MSTLLGDALRISSEKTEVQIELIELKSDIRMYLIALENKNEEETNKRLQILKDKV